MNFMIQIRYAHTRRPIYHIRQTSLRQQSLETPFSSLYRAQTPHPTTQAQGAKGWAHGGPLGPFGVIPKLFRVEGDSERKVFPNGRPPQRRNSGPPQGSAPSRSQCFARSHRPSPRSQRMGPMVYSAPYFSHPGQVIFHVDALSKFVCKMSTKPFW